MGTPRNRGALALSTPAPHETTQLDIDQELTILRGQLAALDRSQAVIEFDLDGTILTANDNFLHAVGYSLDEVQGRHHSMFVMPADAASREYQQFWADLRAGRYQAAEYKRVGKGGREVWIQASYNPILDLNGKPFKVVKYATDITEQRASAGTPQAAVERRSPATPTRWRVRPRN